jgi:hypothetical protein
LQQNLPEADFPDLPSSLLGKGSKGGVITIAIAIGLCLYHWWRKSSRPSPSASDQERLRITLSAADIVRPARVCTENLIRVDDVMESPKLAE